MALDIATRLTKSTTSLKLEYPVLKLRLDVPSVTLQPPSYVISHLMIWHHNKGLLSLSQIHTRHTNTRINVGCQTRLATDLAPVAYRIGFQEEVDFSLYSEMLPRFIVDRRVR